MTTIILGQVDESWYLMKHQIKHYQVFNRDETCFSSEIKHLHFLWDVLSLTQLMETMQYQRKHVTAKFLIVSYEKTWPKVRLFWCGSRINTNWFPKWREKNWFPKWLLKALACRGSLENLYLFKIHLTHSPQGILPKKCFEACGAVFLSLSGYKELKL